MLLAVCRHAGDDVAIALDYRTGPDGPRVVGSDIWTDPRAYTWRVAAPPSRPSPRPWDWCPERGGRAPGQS
ncbi:hypothetical protein GCM10025734_36010 [Kitasatospora paranensis]|uniref:hypothetical protein n=1 Tax=Kitasatospora paranensis TaxID=258053 RepID=UPI0031EA2965